MHQKRLRLFRLLRPLIHFGIILLIFYITYEMRLVSDFIPGVHLDIPLINIGELKIFAVVSAAAFVVIGWMKKLYELNKTADNYIRTLTKVWLYWFISITFISYFGQGFVFWRGISRFVILFSAFLTYFVLFIFDQIWYRIDFKLQKKVGKKILIISNNMIDSYEIIEKIKENFSSPTEFVESKDLDAVDFANYSMTVALGTFDKDTLQTVFERIRFYETRFFHISEGYFLEDVVYKPEKIDNIIAMEYKHSKLDGRSLVVKRLFDIVGSFLGIILASPVMLVVALLIKIDSEGPIIYKSKRVGKGGKEFTFYKFRTMYTHMSVGYGGEEAEKLYKKLVDSDANNRKGILPKIKNDPRVTKLGKFLRKSSLDELPQLFQIFIGTMSLVGPRPHLPNEVAKYEAWQKRVLSIKPGITGYAQVFGRDELPFEEEAKLDLYYIQNWSLAMDIYVIFATFGVVFKGR
ncbi:MAG: sugar transferase [Candidatus Absconditabacteria bacterium]|nr:sugar transferase [Candidatus Absconditabacteria bacterium]MDD3868070.1 sugar transferase [Candidatus Absconditabacteria bacterium]MDD4714317.1 sugar transferase [Candidatus Absconditabacteria bacterium]